MIKIVFLRLAPWMGFTHPHPQDAPYAFDIAQVCAFLDHSRYEVIFIDGMVKNLSVEKIAKMIISINPNILALTANSSSERFALEVFKIIKCYSPDIYLIGFGQHAHYSPQTFLNEYSQIDACVYGEPELTLFELIRDIPRTPDQKKGVKGIYYWNNQLEKTPERPLTIDLDEWLMPRYDIFKKHNYRIVSLSFPTFKNIKSGWVLASRGCPHQCTICSPAIRRSFGTVLRKHSPKRIADTFRVLARELGVNTIYFGDDTFSLDMEWADKVCDELIRRKNRIQWGMSTRVDKLSSKLIEKMRVAGLRAVSIGVESGAKRILKDINKVISHEQIEWAIAELQKNNVSVNLTAIVGHIDETADELNQTFSFLKKTKSIFVQLHYLSPYPGTKIEAIFKERLNKVGQISHFNAQPMNVSKMPDNVLFGSIPKFYLDYYISFGFIKKYISFRLPYLFANPIKEMMLIKDSLAYFLSNSKRRLITTGENDRKYLIFLKKYSSKIFVPRQSISIRWMEIFKSFFGILFYSGSGNSVMEWETKFADFINVPYAISFISGRAGMYFALKALKEMNNWENPEIICPSYTFFSVPWSAKLAGWKVRIADVNKEDLTMDYESLNRQINKDTKAVIVAHLNGKPANMLDISKISKENNLRIIEDCAHAVGIKAYGKQVGAWDIGCFSFGDGKSLGTFGGGMITTSDSDLAEALKKTVSGLRSQAKIKLLKKVFDTFLLKAFTTKLSYPFFLYPLLRWFGYLNADNRQKDFLDFSQKTSEKDIAFKFSDMQAWVGLSQLGDLNKRNDMRRANSRFFRRVVSKKISEKLLPWDGSEPHAMLHDAIRLNRGMDMVNYSLKRGIDFRLDYCGNCRNFPGMQEFSGEDKIGRDMDGKIFFIPNHLGMNRVLSENIASALDSLFIESGAGIYGGPLIRLAVKADIGDMTRIVNKSFDPLDNHRILGEKATTAIFNMFIGLQDPIFLIAEDNGRILGYLWLQLRKFSLLECLMREPIRTLSLAGTIFYEGKLKDAFKFSNSQSEVTVPYPKIVSLAVDIEARRKGVGSTLISAIQEYLDINGFKDYFVLTSATNLEAISFYEKNMFHRYAGNIRGNLVFNKSCK